MFPREIFERILFFCNGKTLYAAERVNEDWRKTVEYLTINTDIWKHCCLNDIPNNELLQYRSKWIRRDDEDGPYFWKHIYCNWLNWHNIEEHIDINVDLKGRIQRISCISVAGATGNYLAIGLENGLVKIYNWDLDCIKTFRHVTVSIDSLHMICDDNGDNSQPEEILVHCCERVYINDFKNCDIYQPVVFPNCFKFSNFKKFICGVTREGKITIGKVIEDTDGKKTYTVLQYLRIFSPETVTAVRLWENHCIILIDSKVKIISYDKKSLKHLNMPTEKVRLKFTKANMGNAQNIRILNDKVIIALSKSADYAYQQMFELFILGDDNTYSKKIFLPWVVFTGNITAMLLYGNTFLIGMSNGNVYFYQVDDWKHFDMNNYNFASNMAKACPIISFDVVELYGRRVFFATSNLMIYQITGNSMDALDDGFPTFS